MRDDGAGRGPTTISAGFAVGAAGIAAATSIGGGWGVVFAPLGALVFGGGLWRRHDSVLALGCLLLVTAAFATAMAGGPPALLILSVAATFVAWDLGEYALVLGEQLGQRGETRRLEVVHVGGSLAVATVGVSGSYVVFSLAGRGEPLTALVLLLVGAVVLLVALGRF